ncbi:MAG: NAD(P)H-quinone oxidoreductase [Gammaproteobacteria bacterium]
MRAWCITQSGGPEVLKLEIVPVPQMGPEEVLVSLQAIGVNRADLLQRRGLYPAPPGFDARVPGMEYAGVVEQVGARCRLRHPGDAVMGIIGGGAYAERLVIHERETLRVPGQMTFTDAAAVPEAFLTAYRALYLEGGLVHGEWCLIRAATSGVGMAAVQLANVFGNRSIGTSRSAQRLEKVRASGLDAACVDSEDTLVECVRGITCGEGVSVVLDLVGGGHLAENLACLREEGTQVLVGAMAGREDRIDLGGFLNRRLKLKAMTMRSQPLERKIELARLFVRRLTPMFESGKLRACVDTVVPFSQAPEAHRRMEAGGHLGKIVIAL